ncbi:MAG TPA: bifunctional phosphopantothenoylcysteine decarboxylase/phosphopantothenate--cysteine ligase CoaBC [Polyangiaceae bacterium]|nr:bifunctional phosphopantothenoylcysteine decarboxylase/phosphopantothenate--cysteine ligase CoaBC [Polyangiaceae bacterium]
MRTGKTVTLCVSGSIAAYKAAELARLLLGAGVRVLPVMTARAESFLGAATLAGLTGEPVRRDMWDASFAGEMHVALAAESDLVVLAPATADLLARLAAGRADDLVTALALVASCPVLVAPAMHPTMWAHPATRRNVERLRADGRVRFAGPVEGPVASGEVGLGRMAEPAAIADEALALLGPRDLAGLRVIVSAGPTVEDIDPVRYLSNRSSGQMGFALARAAAARGAAVTLVAGPVGLATPPGVRRVDVRGALSMREALWGALGPGLEGADALVMSAAVSDFRPAEAHGEKRKRAGEGEQARLELVQNPDLLAEIGRARGGRARPVLVGFAVETASDERMVAYARGKLRDKGVDLVVANHAADSLGRPDNRAILVTEAEAEALPPLAKGELAGRILDRVARLCAARPAGPAPAEPLPATRAE